MAKVLIEKVDGRVLFTFNDATHYQYNGTAEWPLNSLSMVIDDSNMVTFKNMAGDIVYSILLSDLEKTKEEMEDLYADVFIGNTGGGGGGVTPEEVQGMIDDSLTQYYTSGQTDAAISAATSGKVDTSALTQYYTSSQTDAVISAATSGKADTTAVTAAISAATSGKADALDVEEQLEVAALAITDLYSNKLDTSAYTPVDLSEYYTSGQTDAAINAAVSGKVDTSALTQYYTSGQTDAAINAAVSGKADTTAVTAAISAATSGKADTTAVTQSLAAKQDVLTAGSGITINNNVISADGGGGVTVDPSLDSGSTNPVANSAITTAINAKAGKSEALGVYQFGSLNNIPYVKFRYVNNNDVGTPIYYPKINGKGILTSNSSYASDNYFFNLVETSAVTTSMTSSSTNSQVPSAKAVYDQLGGIKLVKCSQAEYDALVQAGTVDADTLYIISNVVTS